MVAISSLRRATTSILSPSALTAPSSVPIRFVSAGSAAAGRGAVPAVSRRARRAARSSTVLGSTLAGAGRPAISASCRSTCASRIARGLAAFSRMGGRSDIEYVSNATAASTTAAAPIPISRQGKPRRGRASGDPPLIRPGVWKEAAAQIPKCRFPFAGRSPFPPWEARSLPWRRVAQAQGAPPRRKPAAPPAAGSSADGCSVAAEATGSLAISLAVRSMVRPGRREPRCPGGSDGGRLTLLMGCPSAIRQPVGHSSK